MVQAVDPSASQSAPAVVRAGFVPDPVTWVGFCVRVLRFSHVSIIPSASISLFYSSATFPPKLLQPTKMPKGTHKTNTKAPVFLFTREDSMKNKSLIDNKILAVLITELSICGFVDGIKIYI